MASQPESALGRRIDCPVIAAERRSLAADRPALTRRAKAEIRVPAPAMADRGRDVGHGAFARQSGPLGGGAHVCARLLFAISTGLIRSAPPRAGAVFGIVSAWFWFGLGLDGVWRGDRGEANLPAGLSSWKSMREVLMPSPVGVVCVGVENQKKSSQATIECSDCFPFFDINTSRILPLRRKGAACFGNVCKAR